MSACAFVGGCGAAQELRGKWVSTDAGCVEKNLDFTDSSHVMLTSEHQACYFELIGTQTLEINRADKVRHRMPMHHEGDRLTVDWPATFGGGTCGYRKVGR